MSRSLNIREHPWSFHRGTLRERLEWCRDQHAVNGESREAMEAVGAQSFEQRRDFHRACVQWYEEMLEQLKVSEYQREELREAADAYLAVAADVIDPEDWAEAAQADYEERYDRLCAALAPQEEPK